jgi:hypothetical protein
LLAHEALTLERRAPGGVDHRSSDQGAHAFRRRLGRALVVVERVYEGFDRGVL